MENIFGKRLESARKMAGLSLEKLAKRLGNMVSRQALHKYEKGKMQPDSRVLNELARALRVPVDFFFSIPEVRIELSDADFRKHTSKISKTSQNAILEKARIQLERYMELENILHIKQEAAFFKFDKQIEDISDAERAARELRDKWDLGYDPVPDVVLMLEDKGYKMLDLEAPEGFDGLAAHVNGEAVIVLNTLYDNEPVRKRFTALHELAHHALDFPEEMAPRKIEKLCHVFASAVLIPEESVFAELDKGRFHFYENELVLIKERWGISFPALFSRALNLGIIGDNTFKKLMIGYRKKGLHKNEPGRFLSREKPLRMEKMIYQALARDILSVNEAAYFSGMNVWEFRHKSKRFL